MSRAIAMAVLVVLTGACKDDGGNGKKKNPTTLTTPNGMLQTQTYSDTADNNGYFEVEVEVGADVTSFQVTGDSEMWVSLEELYDPNGFRILYWEDWWDSPQSLTDAFFGSTKVTAFDWPIRDVDGDLTPGTYRAVMSLLDDRGFYAGGADVDVAINTKTDPDFNNATVGVQIAYADGVDGDPAVVAAVETAVARWRDVWGAAGLTLQEHYVSTDLDPTMQWTYTGDPSVEAVAQQKAVGDVQLIVGDKIRNENFTYGISAGIPGTIEATGSTYVVLSWIVHAGPDAVFDDGETQLMGETMAHEVGHYAGLYHPVEDGFYYWDAIDDTIECTGANQCENQLGTNLMFPYSICNGQGCVTTEDLTVGQASVMQRYMGAL